METEWVVGNGSPRVHLGEFPLPILYSPQHFTQRPEAIFMKASISPFRGSPGLSAKEVYSVLLTPKSSLRLLHVHLQLRSLAWLTLGTREPLSQRYPALLQPMAHDAWYTTQESLSSYGSLHAGTAPWDRCAPLKPTLGCRHCDAGEGHLSRSPSPMDTVG